MKFITDVPDEQLLPLAYNLVDDIKIFLDETKILEVRKTQPKDGVSVTEQGKKNIKEMARQICIDYPNETAKLLRRLWILDEGETEDDIPNAFISLGKILSNKWIIDFFISLMPLM